jgi:polar amino acid transport system substrate-binding protein
MARPIASRALVCVAAAALWALSGRAWPAETLRLVADRFPPFEDLQNDKSPGFSVEVLRHVFPAMGQEATFEFFPTNRGWAMVANGERDGKFSVLRTSERARICYFPDEPLKQERWVFFVRKADAGKLKFSSFDDLAGHKIAVHEPAPGVNSRPTVSPELWKFLQEHHNAVEALGPVVSFRMLAAGHVDYAIANLTAGTREVAAMGLSGEIEPLLSHSVIEDGLRVCFSKARVTPAFVDTFSRTLKHFKQSNEFQTIYRKYFPSAGLTSSGTP